MDKVVLGTRCHWACAGQARKQSRAGITAHRDDNFMSFKGLLIT